MWKDFKAFAFKGNVIDLAVAVVIGAAFTAVVSAIVDGIIMPIIGAISPGGDWQTWTLWHFHIGVVLAAIVNLLVIAFVLFLIVTRVVRAIAKPVETVAPPTETERLLREIRDLLAGSAKPR
jgi:large conductance mechanosensitive channel